jgi:hypothetical protein
MQKFVTLSNQSGAFRSVPDFEAGSGSTLLGVRGSGSAQKIYIWICRPHLILSLFVLDELNFVTPPWKDLKQAVYINFKFIYHLVLNLDEIFQGYTSLYLVAFSS